MMSADDVKYIVIHCSATRRNQNYTVEQMRKDHKERGFYDIGYHFYIRKDGTRTQHRMLLEVGAHAKPYNRCSIGICYEGGLDEEGNSCNTLTRASERRFLICWVSCAGCSRGQRWWGTVICLGLRRRTVRA